ncbi:MAG TPA: M14 family metallopeptidase [Cyclobacteriaceae bacterium]|nr:M14 family metallopeptidase [Cyclobacteriaceae bacterium]
MDKIKRLFVIVLLLLAGSVRAQVDLSYYLPEGYTYNPSIPTPASVLGYQVGEWHVSHDQVVMYMKALAAASDRIQIEEYGRTYEKRPLLLLTITAPSNFSRLDEIKSQRNNLRDPQASVSMESMPIVMYMGHSVHGNEPSGVNASLLSAYHFAAANEIAEDLENIVILFDPAINPDGINRFASWVNSHKSYHMNGDPNNRELNEAWPRGRTNHYWFDLNRDWLPVQHPESRGRIEKIQEWKPNLVLDFHEMGTNSTFFFQPGVPSRNHPLTPKKNFELTEKIATYHAKHLDKIGSLYYTQESFDDFYFGKGSTYPDIQGAVGILFEQASSRGHLQESQHGLLTFPFTIRNQFTTALSSFEAARDMRVEMNQYMQDFYKEAMTEANADPNSAYIFGSKEDAARVFHLADIIQHHDIRLFKLKQDVTLNGVEFRANNSFIVPLNQPQYRLIKGMFETRTEFQDSLFYDVSAWTFPMAFNVDYLALNSKILNLAEVEEVKGPLAKPEGSVIGAEGAYSYAFEWKEYYAPKAAYKLLNKGYLVRVSHEPFQTASGQQFSRGTILVTKGQSTESDQEFYQSLQQAAKESGVTVHALSTGYTSGVNLGSPGIQVLEKPSIALLVEGGVYSNEAGEIWHLLDQRFEMPATLLPLDQVSRVDLSRYNVLIMPNGNYTQLGKQGASKLESWVRGGGTLLARGSAMSWLAQNELANFAFKTETEADSAIQKNYARFAQDQGSKVTGGAIFNVRLDISHPIGYGYTQPTLTTFRAGNQFLQPASNPYANPLIYTDAPLAAGYVYPFNLEQIKNSGAIQVAGLGSGKIIGYVDNPNFRAFWFGTNKLFMNGIFFGQTIDAGTAR